MLLYVKMYVVCLRQTGLEKNNAVFLYSPFFMVLPLNRMTFKVKCIFAKILK